MKSQISPWGNSLASRIPKYIADENEAMRTARTSTCAIAHILECK